MVDYARRGRIELKRRVVVEVARLGEIPVEGWKAIGVREPVLFCPCHDGVFDHRTGAVLAGPPPSPIPEISLEERGGRIVAVDWKDPLPMYQK